MTADSHDTTGESTPRQPVGSLPSQDLPQDTSVPAPSPYPAEQTPGTAAYAYPYPAGQTPGKNTLGGASAPQTNTLAIVSLVTGFFCSIAAVITGHLALGQIRRTNQTGRGLAIAGLVLGYLGIFFTVLAIIFAVLFAASIGAFFSQLNDRVDAPGRAPSVASGEVGAANLDEGYLEVGAGATVVDLYIDPMCPFCGQFDSANGDTLAALAADDSITLRLHPLTFLDSASGGTQYSSRASAALTCEAAINPDTTLDYLAALFADQPAEGTTGLSDEELVALSTGADSIAECVSDGEYLTWAQQNTERAITGPDAIQGTPTVLVDGSRYQGPINDPEALTAFILGPVA
jgi:protein-disulfide isomerase